VATEPKEEVLDVVGRMFHLSLRGVKIESPRKVPRD
jgi:hypothetical protein